MTNIIDKHKMDIEGVILTGGKSERMGVDKAKILVDGIALAEKIATELARATKKVTVLGREPIIGFDFILDDEEFAGPLSALANFSPTEKFVFVASCDLPFFESSIVSFFKENIDSYDAVVPKCQDKLQPLCALYCADSWELLKKLKSQNETRIMSWMNQLKVREISETDMRNANIDPRIPLNINSNEDFQKFFGRTHY